MFAEMLPNVVTNHSFLIFFIYIAIFMFSTVTAFIYGNVHWTLKTAPQHHHQPSPFFSDFFHIYIPTFIFSTATATPSIYGSI